MIIIVYRVNLSYIAKISMYICTCMFACVCTCVCIHVCGLYNYVY